MAKYYGVIGFIRTEETAPSVWTEQIEERPYYGDIISNSVRWQNGSSANDDLNLNTKISILADTFAMKNLSIMKYAELYGEKWKITNIEPVYPRLTLTIGGVYNEQAED